MTTISDWLPDAEKRLSAIGSDAPRLEAQLLAAHILLVDRNWIVAHPREPLPEHAAEALLQRREAREPLAYILGRREFYGRLFAVRPGVLIPRQETETLVEAALLEPRPMRLLDLGTGSGALGITLKLERPEWDVTGSDISPSALEIAQENARELGADVRFVLSDGFAAPELGRFDLIVVNPPYIARGAALIPEIAGFEPELALYGGDTGLQFYQMLAAEAGEHLEPDGALITELGDGMAGDVEALFARAGWKAHARFKDLLGIDRCLVLQPT